MARSISLFEHSAREAKRQLASWVGGHITSTIAGFLAAFLGVPAYLLLSGVSMITLQQELAQVVAYSLIGPVLLIILAYFYFLLQAPRRAYAARTDELKDLRVRLGISIDDLEKSEPVRGSLPSWLTYNAYRVISGALLFLFLILGVAVGAYVASEQNYHTVFKLDQEMLALNQRMVGTERGLIVQRNTAISAAVSICDKYYDYGDVCAAARRYSAGINSVKSAPPLPQSLLSTAGSKRQ